VIKESYEEVRAFQLMLMREREDMYCMRTKTPPRRKAAACKNSYSEIRLVRERESN